MRKMDFRYATALAVFLLVQGTIGQDGQDDKTLSFSVSIIPSSATKEASVGDSLVLTCKHDKPTESPTLTWYNGDGEAITDTDSSSRVRIENTQNGVRLRIDSIEDNDNGEYKCEGTLANMVDKASIQLVIIKPLTILSSPDQYGVLGEKGIVKCDVTAKPQPSVSWLQEDGSIITTDGKYVVGDQKQLTINDLTFEDSKKYICDIVVETTGEAKRLTIDYQVVELPKVQNVLFDSDQLKVGDEVKISCTATGTPAPTFKFMKGSVDGKGGNEVTTDQVDATAGILTIKSLEANDEAEYTCIAVNRGGSDKKSNKLDVKIPPKITPEIQDIKDAVEEGNKVVKCIAEGDPAPSISWMKQGEAIPYSATNAHPTVTVESDSKSTDELKRVTGTLTFDTVKAGDAGVYECTASNIAGTAKDDFRMDVQFKPHFDVPHKKEEYYGWGVHSTNVTCQAAGNPLPSIKFKRLAVDGTTSDIKTEGEYRLFDIRMNEAQHLSARDLFIEPGKTDRGVFGEYICEASNVQGTAEKTIVFKQAFKPDEPIVKEKSTLSTMATFSIERPENNGGMPITEYMYTYHEEDNPDGAKTERTAVQGKITMVTIKGLKAFTSYAFKAQSISEVGDGKERNIVFKTAEVSKPSKLVMSSSPEGSETTSYELQWTAPNNGGAPITKYTIQYKEVKVTYDDDPAKWKYAGDVGPSAKTRTLTNENARSVKLTGLKADTYYEIRLTATNSKGDSDTEVRYIKTLKGSAGASASAGLGSGVMIAIIIVVIIIIIIVAAVVVFVVKKKRNSAGGDPESGKKEDGKAAAEEEKLIQKESAKVETENDKGDGIEAKQEYEPGQKPDQPAATTESADSQPKGEAPSEPTIQITPDTPEKPDNPSA